MENVENKILEVLEDVGEKMAPVIKVILTMFMVVMIMIIVILMMIMVVMIRMMIIAVVTEIFLPRYCVPKLQNGVK